jgi:transcriptional regulator with XRE-family HTH domain
MWLRAGRTQRNLSLEDVAKVTKIQPRILEKLESGQFEGLPADVFVKGFVRSFAKCVGLPESEAMERYTSAQTGQATAIARALVETMSPTVRLVEPKTLTSEPVDALDAPAESLAGPAHVVEVVHVAELAPIVTAAPVEHVAPAEPVASTPVVEIAASLAASLEPSETATKKKRTRKKSTTAAPKIAAESSDVTTSVVTVSTDGESVSKATAAPKAPRSRKKKTTVTPVVAEAANDAPATLASDVSIETPALETQNDTHHETVAESMLATAPFVRVDTTSDGALATAVDITEPATMAELHEAASIAMSLTSEYELEVAVDDSSADDVQLADGSLRMPPGTIEVEDRTAGTWQPTMPAMSSTPSAPWRRPHLPTQNAYVVPSLVIDDADPDSADREREVRASKDHSRLSFLPPILLDREDRSARQGGLTLAVIILLIAATLTLSYLMRRPSPSGDGVTLLDGQTQLYS